MTTAADSLNRRQLEALVILADQGPVWASSTTVLATYKGMCQVAAPSVRWLEAHGLAAAEPSGRWVATDAGMALATELLEHHPVAAALELALLASWTIPADPADPFVVETCAAHALKSAGGRGTSEQVAALAKVVLAR